MKAKFSGGSLDGQEREGDGFGYRYVAPVYRFNADGSLTQVAPQKLVVETYVRDRDNYQRDHAGEVTAIAFKLESTEPYRKAP